MPHKFFLMFCLYLNAPSPIGAFMPNFPPVLTILYLYNTFCRTLIAEPL